MAPSMALKTRAFRTGCAPRPALGHAARVAPVARAEKDAVSLVERLAPTILAAVVTISLGLGAVEATYPPMARADSEDTLSSYDRRRAEMEKRRQLLQEAREKAAARASGTAEPAPPPSPAAASLAPAAAPEKPANDVAAQAQRLKQESLKTYETAAKNRPALPITAEKADKAVEEGKPSPPAFGGFSFNRTPKAPEPAAAPEPAKPAMPAAAKPAEPEPTSKPAAAFNPWQSTKVAPAPAAPTPAKPTLPVPVPVPNPAPAKVEVPNKQEAKKEATQSAAAKPGKRRGPLPLWFAEILVLFAYAGIGLAVTKYSKESDAVLKAASEKVVQLYNTAEKAVGKGSSA